MKHITLFLRSFFFCIVFYTWSASVLTFFLWTIVLPKKIGNFVPTLWAKGNLVILNMFGLKVKIEGKENLPKKNGYLVAAKHQSALETTFIHAIVPNTIYVLKKSLMLLPLAGIYFWSTGCIPINRSKGTSAMRYMMALAKERLKQGFNITIFPEGTRCEPHTKTKYNPGVAFIYEQCNVPVVPIALNTGFFWPKNSFKKYPGTITVRILPPIPSGLEKREFLHQLETQIETACEQIKP